MAMIHKFEDLRCINKDSVYDTNDDIILYSTPLASYGFTSFMQKLGNDELVRRI